MRRGSVASAATTAVGWEPTRVRRTKFLFEAHLGSQRGDKQELIAPDCCIESHAEKTHGRKVRLQLSEVVQIRSKDDVSAQRS